MNITNLEPENHARQNASGWMDTITEYVRAMDDDLDDAEIQRMAAELQALCTPTFH